MISPVTCGSWASGGSCVLVDQAVEDGFSADPSAVEAGFGAAARVMFSLGDVLGDALVRPGHVVVRLILSQHGAAPDRCLRRAGSATRWAAPP